MNKKDIAERRKLLSKKVKHIDITKHDTRALIKDMREMSFSARDLARASEIYDMMLKDKNCGIFLTLAGSTSAAGCMQIYVDLVKNNMVDVIVSTGASIIDMDLLEALGFNHYHGSPFEDDGKLRKLYIDRIYDTYIDEEELQVTDMVIREIADTLEPRPYSSQEFIWEIGKWLSQNPKRAKKKDSLIQRAYENNVPIFCPAFSDSSAGFGLVKHQVERPDAHVTIDSVRDFHDVTRIKMKSGTSGVLMIGGGVPKNFTADTIICAEILGQEVPMHKYTVQLTVADARDGALSGSTLKEAHSWGKVDRVYEQMVFTEATASLPLLAGYAYHTGSWKKRKKHNFAKILKKD
ncbi:deoxyhypusine synthase [Candidatus Parcubacteria bacterium]|uniref:Deoxyhypusine synthase-like protein n=1 Tax=Candidatus Kaiserbacteria bacterium CG10_big_fil_rev_8_21_14_0_10_47_16 TaxID=1974608 RepID=A0A2H0UEC4_9BACT|nr:deoxyhypusine synthase [Candidatus Parcubacteria bacterium]PIR84759.1 MAG: deoxyhypusine synthase [Candidatus Kaiserbacteria bacterium CG10_big_fil_rev_8_21_14_0_10_47_16]